MKTNKITVALHSLGIAKSLLSTQWVANGFKFLNEDSEDLQDFADSQADQSSLN